MAHFHNWYKIAEQWEGGYVNDPDDKGGETYKGITRRFSPKWRGWPLIDAYKQSNGGKLPRNWFAPKTDSLLQAHVEDEAKRKFWDVFQADSIESDSVAVFLVDFGFHSGTVNVTKRLQRILGITRDGVFGPKTLQAVNNASPVWLFNMLKEERVNLFHNIVAKDATQQKFLKGWLRRADSFVFNDSDTTA